MDGENHGNPYFLMDDLGGFSPYFWETPIYMLVITFWGLLLGKKSLSLFQLHFSKPPTQEKPEKPQQRGAAMAGGDRRRVTCPAGWCA